MAKSEWRCSKIRHHAQDLLHAPVLAIELRFAMVAGNVFDEEAYWCSLSCLIKTIIIQGAEKLFGKAYVGCD